jgi:hypothetical protein
MEIHLMTHTLFFIVAVPCVCFAIGTLAQVFDKRIGNERRLPIVKVCAPKDKAQFDVLKPVVEPVAILALPLLKPLAMLALPIAGPLIETDSRVLKPLAPIAEALLEPLEVIAAVPILEPLAIIATLPILKPMAKVALPIMKPLAQTNAPILNALAPVAKALVEPLAVMAEAPIAQPLAAFADSILLPLTASLATPPPSAGSSAKRLSTRPIPPFPPECPPVWPTSGTYDLFA